MKFIQVSFVINNVYNYDSEFGMKVHERTPQPLERTKNKHQGHAVTWNRLNI